jgi:hypothetical protein
MGKVRAQAIIANFNRVAAAYRRAGAIIVFRQQSPAGALIGSDVGAATGHAQSIAPRQPCLRAALADQCWGWRSGKDEGGFNASHARSNSALEMLQQRGIKDVVIRHGDQRRCENTA